MNAYAEMWRQVVEEASKLHIEPWELAMRLLEATDAEAMKVSAGLVRAKPQTRA